MFLRSMSELRSLGLVAAMGLIPLGGCAIVDQYGSRAIEYNDQAAASKSSTILLNIMRAAYREPLQFTDLSTVTGLASAQGSLNASIPARIGGHFTTANAMELHHPKGIDYWYLHYAGVCPEHQGKGWGGAAIREGLTRARSGGLPVYLETAKELNVALYLKLGFKVVGEWDVSEGGPRFWSMLCKN